jgi:hypothetical protein
MKILYAFGWLPAPVFYLESLGGWGGLAVGPIIFITEKYRDDQGLHLHELEHVEQAWRGLLVVHGLRYRFQRSYRLRAEVAAYRRQIAAKPQASIDYAVRALAHKYDLRITEGEARRYLQEGMQ